MTLGEAGTVPEGRIEPSPRGSMYVLGCHVPFLAGNSVVYRLSSTLTHLLNKVEGCGVGPLRPKSPCFEMFGELVNVNPYRSSHARKRSEGRNGRS